MSNHGSLQFNSAYRQSFPFARYGSYYILNEYSGINGYQQKIISIHVITDFSQTYSIYDSEHDMIAWHKFCYPIIQVIFQS